MSKKELLIGQVKLNKSGKGIFEVSENEKYFLPKREMFKVFPNDKVKCSITFKDRAKIVEVIERNTKTVKGILKFKNKKYFLNSIDSSYDLDVLVESKISDPKKVGNIFEAKITKQPSLKYKPTARIISSKKISDPFEEAYQVAVEGSDIEITWPKSVIGETNRLDKTFKDENESIRKDLREFAFVTIDGKSAKDFDDALFAKKINSGFKLFVAIADVAEYVKFNSALDLEAINRGTSIYFRRKVIPMLPEKISNNLCSLRPDEDKLTLTCEMKITEDGNLENFKFYNSIIRSKARLTYEKLGKQFEKDKPSLLKDVSQSLESLEKIYRLLAKKRLDRQAIDFDLPEYSPMNDKENNIKSFRPLKRNHSHQLVEECMILANVCAAELISKSKIPSVYRSHEKPDPLKIANLKNFLTSRQIKNNMDSYKIRENLISWMKVAKTKKISEVIIVQILRSMSLAKYDPKLTSHFALSLDKYTHFTSPIRRYADLIVHRCIKELLTQGINSVESKKTFIKNNAFPYSLDAVAEIAEDISLKDRNAEKISRKETKFLQCKCAENYIGKSFNGSIVSAFEFGVFIKIEELNIEGFVHVSKLSKKDYLVFDESSMAMRSTKNKKSFYIGDSLKIKIESVEPFKGRVNLSIN